MKKKNIENDDLEVKALEERWLERFRLTFHEKIRFNDLPETILESMLVEWLWIKGSVYFFPLNKIIKTPYIGDWTAQQFNLYNFPAKARPVIPNSQALGASSTVLANDYFVDPLKPKEQEAVIMFLKPLVNPTAGYVYNDMPNGTRELSIGLPMEGVFRIYCHLLALLDRLLEQNIILASHPVLINGMGLNDDDANILEEQLKQMKTVIKTVKSAKRKGLLQDLETIDLKGQFIADKILQAKQLVLQEAYDWLGIENVGYEKKERLTFYEVESQRNSSSAYFGAVIKQLEEGLDQVNRVFSLNITLEDPNPPAPMPEDGQEGANQNGKADADRFTK